MLPLEYLQTASNASLEAMEMSLLAHAAKLRKQIMADIEKWVEDRTGADLARLLRENAQLRGITLDPRQENFDWPEGAVSPDSTEAGKAQGGPFNRAAA